MSTNTAQSAAMPAATAPVFEPVKASTMALIIGAVGLGLTIIGFFFSGQRAALSALMAFTFWLSIGLGMLFMVMLHHIFDAGWSTVIRRQLEHGLAAIPWLGVLFIPLFIIGVFQPGGVVIWKWLQTDSAYVALDPLFHHKGVYLSTWFFTLRNIFYFGSWIVLAWYLRKASFTQDSDGSTRWTGVNRKLAAAGLIVASLTLTFAAIDWIKTLEYHWFSTMFGVWFFSGAMRAALAVTVILCVVLVRYRVFTGIFTQNHLYELGRLMLAFTIFWAYITFSQYFLIQNANIPEETFFYVVREHGQWQWLGFGLLFGYFFFPFLYLLFHANKVSPGRMVFISCWILVFALLDIYFNILPSLLTADLIPIYSFLSGFLIIDLAALAGVGGICVWAYLRSYVTTKPIPVRDPRILEAINHHV